MSDPSRRFRGWVWSEEEQRYIIPDEHTKIDAQGVKRGYGVVYDDRGNGYRCGWPGEQRARPRANGGAIIADGVEKNLMDTETAGNFFGE